MCAVVLSADEGVESLGSPKAVKAGGGRSGRGQMARTGQSPPRDEVCRTQVIRDEAANFRCPDRPGGRVGEMRARAWGMDGSPGSS